MRERYIRQVKKALMLSRRKTAEIVRDLQEAFASASEHGESDQQVMERLGTPEDFAASVHEQLGINCEERKEHRKRLLVVMALMAAFVSFFLSAAIHFLRKPANVIGQAEAMTSIQVSGAGIDPAVIFCGLGLAAVFITVIFIVKSIRKK